MGAPAPILQMAQTLEITHSTCSETIGTTGSAPILKTE